MRRFLCILGLTLFTVGCVIAVLLTLAPWHAPLVSQFPGLP